MSCLFLLDVYGRDRKRLCESWRDRELCVCLLLELLGSKQQQQQQPFNQKLNLIKNVDKVSGEKYFANDEILILLNRFPFYFSFYVMISPPPWARSNLHSITTTAIKPRWRWRWTWTRIINCSVSGRNDWTFNLNIICSSAHLGLRWVWLAVCAQSSRLTGWP